MDEFGNERADDRMEMLENAIDAGEELRKRRSSRIVQAVPLVVTGVDALGRPFVERTSSLIINCHGCRYQSKHYVLKNMWVTLEIPHPEAGQPPRHVRGRVAWIQRPRTVRQLFQVALELEVPGNVWGIGFPPEDWTHFNAVATMPPPAAGPGTGSKPEERISTIAEKIADAVPTIPEPELPPPAIGSESLHLLPPPLSTTDASLQLARQVARLIADAKQQISAAARDAAAKAVATEHRDASEQLQQNVSAARSVVSEETGRAIARVQQESEERSKAAHTAAARALQDELPKWLAPHLEEMTRELAAGISRASAEHRALQEQQLNGISERVQQLCREAEEVARRIVTQAQEAERRLTERASASSAVLETHARRHEQSLSAQHEQLLATAGAAQQQLADTLAGAQSELQTRLSERVEAARAQVGELVESAVARLQETATASRTQGVEHLRAQLQGEVANELEQRIAALRDSLGSIVGEAEERIHAAREGARGEILDHTERLNQATGRANEAVAQLDQLASRLGTTQQLAIESFQSQLDDVLTLHRNELHRRSESLFDELNARVRKSFGEAMQDAAAKFDEQIRSLAEPHIERTNEAIHRLAGGRSLLDAALTLQQDRIRNSADEAFAESLARFRENLGGVEQLLHEMSQGVVTRNLAELESKAGDVRHRVGEEIYKTAEWYEKKVQTQLNGLTDRMVETSANQLREKAGEVSAEFAAELDHSSRNFVGHAHNQMQEAVRESFERARELFAEAADTTTAAFMDEIQRHARQELEGFTGEVSKVAETSNREFAVSREQLIQRLSSEQESFLQRFQSRMAGALEGSVSDAQNKIQAGFAPLLESWQQISEQQREEMRTALAGIADTATGDYKSRLDNVSNAWLLATVAKLDQRSRDIVTGISSAAEEKLRAACAEVFASVGETLRKRLGEITDEFTHAASAGSSK